MSELQTLEISLSAPIGMKLNQSIGSVLHGLMMQQLDTDYAEVLHQQRLRPYSQYLVYDKTADLYKWHINAFSKEAVENLLLPMQNLPQEFYLEQKACNLKVLDKKILNSTCYSELEEQIFTEPKDYFGVDVNFLSTTSFKSNDMNIIYPDAYLILLSLVRKWNAFSTSSVLDEPDLVNNLAGSVYVADYNLRFSKFFVGKGRISGFQGKYRLAFKGNSMVRKLVSLLFAYANFTGIGVKTALGMGAVSTNSIKVEGKTL